MCRCVLGGMASVHKESVFYNRYFQLLLKWWERNSQSDHTIIVSFLLYTQAILCVNYNVSLNPPDVPAFIPIIPINSLINCSQFVGYLAVYRVCMAVASFFLLLMLMMFCVCSTKDPRAYIQNGYVFYYTV